MKFMEINYNSDLKFDRPKQRTLNKTLLKDSEQLEKISPLDFRNNQY